MNPVLKKTIGLTAMVFLALFMYFGTVDSTHVAFANGSIDGVKSTGGGATPQVVTNVTGTVGAIVKWLYYVVVAFFAIKFLREKQYGQFWMFFIVALMVYTLIFAPDVLQALANQVKTLFGG